MKIYCSHEYGGNKGNLDIIERKITKLQLADKSNTYISPVHCFGYLYDMLSYDDGIKLCLDLLSACDKVMVLSGMSKGVNIEIGKARQLGIPIEFKVIQC